MKRKKAVRLALKCGWLFHAFSLKNFAKNSDVYKHIHMCHHLHLLYLLSGIKYLSTKTLIFLAETSRIQGGNNQNSDRTRLIPTYFLRVEID